MYAASIPDTRLRRKQNVARRNLLKSRQRLLWLWPQYFPKHDMASARLKTDQADTFETECDVAEVGLRGDGRVSRIRPGFDYVDGSKAAPDDGACGPASDDARRHSRAGDYWFDPGWREAARQYHVARAGRLLVTEIQPPQLTRIRKLMLADISLDRVWQEVNEGGEHRSAFQVTFNALVYELRSFGVAAFKNPDFRRQLADLSDPQLREVLAALIRTRARNPAITDELLIALDEIRR